MLRFFSGVAVGIYLAQEYPSQIAPFQSVLKGLTNDLKRKFNEYQSSNDDNNKK
jgi:hypothetical protein